MTIKDIYGNAHDLTPLNVHVMLGVGWASFLGSWLINIVYYKFHPSAVEMDPRSDEKKTLFVFGRDVFSSENQKPSLDAEVAGEFLFRNVTSFICINIKIAEGKEMEMESLTGDITEDSTDRR